MIALRTDARPSAGLSVWLDAFRGVAAVAVVTGHAYALLVAGSDPRSSIVLRICADLMYFLSVWAHQAVIIFFVMSGYLVGGPFLIKSFQGNASASNYAAARISRMYTVLIPALFLTLALDFIGLHYLNGQVFINAHADFFPLRPRLLDQLNLATFACNSIFLQGISCYQYGSNLSLWSLSNEAIYYALWLALILSLTKKTFRFTLPVLIVIVVASFFIAESSQRAIIYGVYLIVWIAGALASATLPVGKWPVTLSLLVSLLVYIIIWKFIGKNGFAADTVLAFLFIALITSIERWDIGFPLYDKPVKALAGISYSLYAIHLPILVFVFVVLGLDRRQPAHWTSVALFCFLTILSVTCAAGFWWLFERHTHRVKKWLLSIFRRIHLVWPAAAE